MLGLAVLRECAQAGLLLITPQTAFHSEQSMSEAREAAAAEVRRGILSMRAMSTVSSGALGSANPFSWADGLRFCVNKQLFSSLSCPASLSSIGSGSPSAYGNANFGKGIFHLFITMKLLARLL